MKLTFILLFGLLISDCYYAQEKRIKQKLISGEIKNYITANYPTVKKVKFYQERQNDSIFIEAEFHVGKDEISLKFFQNQWIEKETEFEFQEIAEELKANINNYLRTEYTKHKISECYLVETPKKNNLFEIYIQGTKNKASNFYEIYFDEKGNFIKSEIIETAPIQSLY